MAKELLNSKVKIYKIELLNINEKARILGLFLFATKSMTRCNRYIIIKLNQNTEVWNMTQNELAVAMMKTYCLRSIAIFIGPYYSKSANQAYANQSYLKPISKARKELMQMRISQQLFYELEMILDDVFDFVNHGNISKSFYECNDNLKDVGVIICNKISDFSDVDRVYEEVKYAIETKFDLLITEIEKVQEKQNMEQ